MLINLAIIIILALGLGWIFEKCKLPGLLGMLLTGLLLGQNARDHAAQWMPGISPELHMWAEHHLFFHHKLNHISEELRTLALIVILFRAGLGLKKETLKRIGAPALKMSCLPCLMEWITVTLLARTLLPFSWIESSLLGCILAAVSPAVIVPAMLNLKSKINQTKSESDQSTDERVPTMILAAASLDDILAITLFSSFLSLLPMPRPRPTEVADDNSVNIWHFLEITGSVPISILTGILAGYLTARGLLFYLNRHERTASSVVLILLCLAAILLSFKNIALPYAPLVSIMTIGMMLLNQNERIAHQLANHFKTLWMPAEILLFVIIGALVDLKIAWQAGITGLSILVIGLSARSLGVWLSLIGSDFSIKARLFCVLSYLPKATVQAAIGGVILSLVLQDKVYLSEGHQTGEIILAISFLAILITAPLGAIAIRIGSKHLL